MKVDPESVYFEPHKVWLFKRGNGGSMSAPTGLTIHAKIGARWRSLLLMPDEGESFGAFCGRVAQWYAEEPDTFASSLFDGLDNMRSGDSERAARR